jgi:hypothetical protein
MMKDGEISGALMLEIYKRHLSKETSDSVIADSLQSSIPPIIKNYMPLENFEKEVSLPFLIRCSIKKCSGLSLILLH